MKFSTPLPSPLPTAAPSAAILAQKLALRQFEAQTCGYVDADILDPVTCNPGYTCAYQSDLSIQGCCATLTDCPFVTSCIDYTALPASCNAACMENVSIGKCPSSAPYCGTYTFPVAGLVGYGCGDTQNYEAVAYPTYSGEYQSYVGSSDNGFVAVTVTVVDPGVSPTPAIEGGGSSAQTTGSNSTIAGSSGGNTLSTGTIAGIAVGGAGALILAALVAWLIVCQKRRNRRRRAAYDYTIAPAVQTMPGDYHSPNPGLSPGTPGTDYLYAKEAQFNHTVSQVSSPGLTTPGLSPGVGPGAGGFGGAGVVGMDNGERERERLSRTNLDALQRERMGLGMNMDTDRGSAELARGRRLSEDGTAIPERSVAAVTHFTRVTEDSMRLR